MERNPQNNTSSFGRSMKQSKSKSKNQLDVEDIFPTVNDSQKPSCPQYRLLMRHFKEEKMIKKSLVLEICSKFVFIVKNQPNLLRVSGPLTIVGDIHGQYYDLLKILELGGSVQKSKYLFLGDYVDRGMFSVQAIMLLCILKISFPNGIYMLRGNHQSRHITSHFNFRLQCLSKFDQEVYEVIMDLFDQLPLAAVVDRKYFAVHGGLSPNLKSFSDIQKVNRFIQPTCQGLFCDLLWADPFPELDGQGYKPNKVRACSYYFGKQQCNKFLWDNSLDCIIRAHQVQHKGFKEYCWGVHKATTKLITLFSAPNYCDSYGNDGSIMQLDNGAYKLVQFTASPHPFVLKDFMNVFTWSCPFLAEKVSEIFLYLIKFKPGSKKGARKSRTQNQQPILTESYQDTLISYLLAISNDKQNRLEQMRQASLPPRHTSQEEFAKLQRQDMSEAIPEFGPKVSLKPFHRHNLEDDILFQP